MVAAARTGEIGLFADSGACACRIVFVATRIGEAGLDLLAPRGVGDALFPAADMFSAPRRVVLANTLGPALLCCCWP